MNARKKIAVAGATGRLGRHLVDVVEERGHEVVPISRTYGVDIVTGEGLATALAGVDTVIDAAAYPSNEQEPATEFFVASARNLQQMGAGAGVNQLVVVSIIGIDNFTAGFLAAKKVHEQEVVEGPLPVRILRAAQFHEFVEPLLGWIPQENGVKHVPNMRTQLVAARTVAEALVELATDTDASATTNGTRDPRDRRPSRGDPRRGREARRRASRRRGTDRRRNRSGRSGRRGVRERWASAGAAGNSRRPDLRGMARPRGGRVSTPPPLTRQIRAPPENRDEGGTLVLNQHEHRRSGSADRLLHERGDLLLVGGGQLLQREGGRPHRAVVELRSVVEAERRVPRAELRRALEEADDLAVPRVRGHPVPRLRHEVGRRLRDDRVQSRRHVAVALGHLRDLLEQVALPRRPVPPAACLGLQLLGALAHRGLLIRRESLALRRGPLALLGRSLLSHATAPPSGRRRH